jgi:hypothetical protein
VHTILLRNLRFPYTNTSLALASVCFGGWLLWFCVIGCKTGRMSQHQPWQSPLLRPGTHQKCRSLYTSSSSSSHQAIASTPSAPRPTGAVTTGPCTHSILQVEHQLQQVNGSSSTPQVNMCSNDSPIGRVKRLACQVGCVGGCRFKESIIIIIIPIKP